MPRISALPFFAGNCLKINELDLVERQKIEEIITSGYRTLFDAGIIQIDNYLRLAGAAANRRVLEIICGGGKGQAVDLGR